MNNKETYKSTIVAEYFLALVKKAGKRFNVTKTQKLLYILYGYFLSKNRMLLDEKPKAWPYGPVFPKTTKKKIYQSNKSLESKEFEIIKKDTEVNKFFEIILEKFGDIPSSKLINWTHLEGGPWDLTRKQHNFKWNDIIPDEYIKEYFLENFS